MKEELIIIGGGGHAESVVDSIRSMKHYHIIGIFDQAKKNTTVLGVEVIGGDKDLIYYYHQGIPNVVIAIGSIGEPKRRRRIYEDCKQIGYQFPNIIDSSAVLAESIRMGEGNFIGKGAIINSKVQLGNECIINTGTILEHGSRIEDFVHMAPGSLLCGNVWIKENTHIGARACVLQNVTIGKNTMIGAGSLVLKDITDNQLAYGIPAKEVKRNE
jgi:sugar O-acyltransferase (sialic acid O-acetyltransferase NeuD family)